MISARSINFEGYRFVSAANGLVGWIRKDMPEKIFADFIRDPDALMVRVSSEVVKNGPKSRVVKHALSGGFESMVITKRFQYHSSLRSLGFLLFSSPAARSLRGALLLQSKGFLVPRPLAALEHRSWKSLGTSYYVSEEIVASHSIQTFWQSVVPKLAAQRRLSVTRPVLRDLARLLSGLHSMGIYHRDLKASNILVQGWEGERRRLFLVDLDRVEERRRLPFSKKVNNLLQVRRPAWRDRDTIYFFMRYAEGLCRSKKARKTLVRKIAAFSRRRDHLRRRARMRRMRG